MDDTVRLFETVSRYFSLLAEPMRVRILHAICAQPRTVGEIVAETGATQTNVSRHLNTMYRAGVLSRRKDGNFTWYGVADPTLTEICRTVCVHIAAREDAGQGQRDELLDLARSLDPAARAPRTRRAPAPAPQQV